MLLKIVLAIERGKVLIRGPVECRVASGMVIIQEEECHMYDEMKVQTKVGRCPSAINSQPYPSPLTYNLLPTSSCKLFRYVWAV
mmetsp:Transcript_25024/g.41225  ORF Transcript_25024/g.41225 Transcript_25024/m.41225 type:complete len:84 (+) Transcript_25024:552-803(+)